MLLSRLCIHSFTYCDQQIKEIKDFHPVIENIHIYNVICVCLKFLVRMNSSCSGNLFFIAFLIKSYLGCLIFQITPNYYYLNLMHIGPPNFLGIVNSHKRNSNPKWGGFMSEMYISGYTSLIHLLHEDQIHS